jgi:hypothetical protein
MIEPEFRPASAAADGTEIRDVCEVDIKMDNSISYTILSDPGQGLGRTCHAGTISVLIIRDHLL